MHPARRLRSVSLLLTVLAGLTAAGAAGAQEARSDPRLDRRLALEVRVADLTALSSQLSRSLRVPMETDAEMGTRRVTIHAERTSVGDLQDALAELFRANWQVLGSGEEARYRLAESASFRSAVENLRRQRRTTFLTRLLQTEATLARQRPEVLANALRADLGRRLPYLPEETLARVTPEYVNQVLLVSPLRLGLVDDLARTGEVSVPLSRLSARHQQLLATLFLERYQEELYRTELAADQPDERTSRNLLDPRVLFIPQARLNYRLLFGDRWTGDLLLTRVGTADNWAAAALPSSLFDLPDYASLYTDATPAPESDPALARNVNVNIDTDLMGWDQALLTVARAGKVNVMSDAYLRPEAFRPREKGPIIVGTTLRETLDRIADYYGYRWWKVGDWYLFRNRMFADYEQVSVPPRVIRTITEALQEDDRLTAQGAAALAALPVEQLLSMHLFARAEGKPYAPGESFDLNQMELARVGLMLHAELTDAQRELARGAGIPVALLTEPQQYLFASTAYDRGVVLNPYDRDLWRFRVRETYSRERLPAGWAHIGNLRFTFNYAGMDRQAELGLRVPAAERASENSSEQQ